MKIVYLSDLWAGVGVYEMYVLKNTFISILIYLVGTGSTVAVVDFDSWMSFRIWSWEREREKESISQWKEHWKWGFLSRLKDHQSLNSCLIHFSIFCWKNRENDLAASWGLMSGRESDLSCLFSSVLRKYFLPIRCSLGWITYLLMYSSTRFTHSYTNSQIR